MNNKELIEKCLKKIEERNGELNVFLEVFDDIWEQYEIAKDKAPLHGMPIAIKDNILIEGHKASAASKILEHFTAPYDATVIKRLRDAGAVFIGRTNMDEFAMGSSTENSAYNATRNPHDTSCVPGGSSGGSAASVAADMACVSLGSDTGGSIRQPASFCGVVGFKPTYGRVSRSGLMAMASSLDQIGPFAKTVSDAELIYNILKGEDRLDSTTIKEETYAKDKKFSKVIGVPRAFVDSEGVDAEVKKNFEKSVEKFKSLGYEVRDIDLPHIKYALSVYYVIMPAEVSSNLARFDGVKYGKHVSGENGIDDYFKTRGEGFGKEVRRRIILGTYILSSGYYDEYYGSALKMKSLITQEVRDAFKDIDLILTPTAPTPAFKLGEKTSDPLSMYLADIFTVPANITGCPSISLPSGKSGNLPLGIELTADLGREDNLFIAGKEFLGE